MWFAVRRIWRKLCGSLCQAICQTYLACQPPAASEPSVLGQLVSGSPMLGSLGRDRPCWETQAICRTSTLLVNLLQCRDQSGWRVGINRMDQSCRDLLQFSLLSKFNCPRLERLISLPCTLPNFSQSPQIHSTCSYVPGTIRLSSSRG